MRVFTRIVERRSFTRAAEDLSLPRSTATDAVKRLEARLGVQLLQRTTRSVRPTLDGEAYYQRCLSILSEIEEAEEAFAGAKPRGLLRVEADGPLTRHFILPKLAGFLDSYPDLDLQLSEGNGHGDLTRKGVDCVLRLGECWGECRGACRGEARDALAAGDAGDDMAGDINGAMVVRRVASLDKVTLAAPSYLARFGRPDSHDALTGHQMVGFWSAARGGLLPLEFSEQGEAREMVLPSRFAVSASESYLASARLGHGLIQILRYQAEEDIRAGRLIEVLAATPPRPTPISLLYPRNRQLSPRVRVFLDWLATLFPRRS
ncbi:LysR family transcriptional regulator [Celeribacter neptunius]|nr:LysR family transcriptional regulator [Celeribacter neptunius]